MAQFPRESAVRFSRENRFTLFLELHWCGVRRATDRSRGTSPGRREVRAQSKQSSRSDKTRKR
ncbi:hypothetical protein EB235_14220 [Mesorhizobium loti R88b]|uniref:Uncharacterized protein n=1 Tax=Mesorhizobium loti R88b TaxID=935548 RepID=A0A6M7WJ76_RHILI|nr:hypothetical protein EB235_14220 [Mesorhizobium loti R88b]